VRNLNEKIHPERMKMILYTSFSRFGSILEINTVRRHKLRGQAWIVFKDVISATEAKKKMNNLNLFGKELVIMYAKTKSDIISRLDKTFIPRPKRKLVSEAASESDDRMVEEDQVAPAVKQKRPTVREEPPHHILIAVDVPADVEVLDMEVLFKQYKGFVEVRLVKSRNVAFIEFQDIPTATLAKHGLQDFQLRPNQDLSLNFAKA